MSHDFLVGLLVVVAVILFWLRRGQVGWPGMIVLLVVGAIVFGGGGGQAVHAVTGTIESGSQLVARLGQAVQ